MPDERRDETHVEQHGDGDVNIAPADDQQQPQEEAPEEAPDGQDADTGQ